MDTLGKVTPLGWKDKDCSTTVPMRNLRGREEAKVWGSRPSDPPLPHTG